MSEKRASLEVIAPSVDEAIARGLEELGLSRAEVEVEILDSGTRGFLGLGFRQARVRLTVKASPSSQPFQQPTPPSPTYGKEAALPSRESSPLSTPSPEEQNARLLRVARQTVEDLVRRMHLRARVTASFLPSEEPDAPSPLQVDVQGDDLAVLIGPKAETLNALQYITNLIVSKEVGYSVPIIVDVQGYRARRARQVRQLARRMAEQAIRTGRRQILEPMPANERRLVHLELRDHPQVYTESIGEEPHRKVTIIPK